MDAVFVRRQEAEAFARVENGIAGGLSNVLLFKENCLEHYIVTLLGYVPLRSVDKSRTLCS